MKFIITEHKLDKIIFNYITSIIKNNSDVQRSEVDTFIVYYDKNDEDTVLIEFDDFDGRLYIEKNLISIISDTFNISSETAMIKICDFFEYYEGIKPDFLEGYPSKGGHIKIKID